MNKVKQDLYSKNQWKESHMLSVGSCQHCYEKLGIAFMVNDGEYVSVEGEEQN